MSHPTWYDHYYQILDLVSDELEKGERFHSRDIADILEKDPGAVGKAIKFVNEEEGKPEIEVMGRERNRMVFQYRGGAPPENWETPPELDFSRGSIGSRLRASAEEYATDLQDVLVLESGFQEIYGDVLEKLENEGELPVTQVQAYVQGHPELESYTPPRRLRFARRICAQLVEGIRDIEIEFEGGRAKYKMV